jgi:hypothetical protein
MNFESAETDPATARPFYTCHGDDAAAAFFFAAVLRLRDCGAVDTALLQCFPQSSMPSCKFPTLNALWAWYTLPTLKVCYLH